jgi:hypothetical protein
MTTVKNIFFLIISLLILNSIAYSNEDVNSQEWKNDWSILKGFSLTKDTTGYQYPTIIKFVENPGSNPNDALYYVLELQGKVKVITNDRTVYTFAENFLPVPLKETFDPYGAAGMCLDSESGDIFVTFSYFDDKSFTQKNAMIKFKTNSKVFGLKPSSEELFLDLFANEVAHGDHQIGPCEVLDDQLFVSVGYGNDKSESQNIKTTLGSILRMKLNFEPFDDNPFYLNDNIKTAEDYIWAYGVRNVFGLKSFEGRLFATENGGNIDRFNEIKKGENYLWDGTDWSVAARADYIFSPSVAPVQLDIMDQESSIFPTKYNRKFFVALSGLPAGNGPGRQGERSVIMLDYDMNNNRINSPPSYFMKYSGSGLQLPVNLSFGPDGLYILPLFPDNSGEGFVLKAEYSPDSLYPNNLSNRTAKELINDLGCMQCHEIEGKGGQYAKVLDVKAIKSINKRINSQEYIDQVEKIDAINNQFTNKYRAARHEVLDAPPTKQKTLLWLSSYIREPKFDDLQAKMPKFDITEDESMRIAKYLLKIGTENQTTDNSFLNQIRYKVLLWIPELRYRHILFTFIFGIAFTILGLFIYRRIIKGSK